MNVITFREIEKQDVEALFNIAQCPEIQKLTTFAKAVENNESSKVIFNALVAENKNPQSIKTYAIFEGDKCAGFMTKLQRAHDLHLSYSVASDMRCRGIAEKAVRQMIDCLDKYEKTLTLKLSISSTNLPSIRVAEKLGFSYEGKNPDTKMKIFYLKNDR